jgi:myo-inositol-1(or 4)-monophosphatase
MTAASADDLPGDAVLAEIEQVAAALAQAAGEHVMAARERAIAVGYKDAPGSASFRDPVSDVDRSTELLIRARLAQAFPDHDIVGEEFEGAAVAQGRDAADFAWAIDPIDGTANFINDFPLFAVSIGVLHRRRPVAGAIWCASSPALRPGVYHARRGYPLRFDGREVVSRRTAGVRRRLAGDPRPGRFHDELWDLRQTGSAAIECAYVAAGVFELARLAGPRVWDVAAGIALVQAAGGAVWGHRKGRWAPFDAFDPAQAEDLRAWRGALLMGEPESVARYLARGQEGTLPFRPA